MPAAVERAAGLRIVRFAQDRSGLDPDQSLRRALAPEGDAVTWQGRTTHVASWAKRFLFRPEQLEVPVGRLSGGEQARVLIARLMLEPADVLLLDEPTNDLDIPTLEVLEDNLAEFAGGLVLVTHDRLMLERVSTIVLALDGQGGAEAFADYAQWAAARATASARRAPSPWRRRPRRRRAAPRGSARGRSASATWSSASGTAWSARSSTRRRRSRRAGSAAEDPAVASDPAALQDRYAALDTARTAVERPLRPLGRARSQASLTRPR